MISPNKEAERFYNNVELMREKIIQVIRIKNRLEQRKENLINQLRTSPDKDTINHLWHLYKRELHILKIIKKGIRNVNKFESELQAILIDVGVLKHIWSVVRKKETNMNLQSIAILKFVSKKINKCLKGMNSEFEKVRGQFLHQFRILKRIRNSSLDQNLINNFIEEYDAEVKSIKKFYRKGINDLLIKIMRKISPKEAAKIIGMEWIIPGPTVTSPTAIFLFGTQYGAIMAIILAVIKYLSLGGYTTYVYKRA